MNRLEIIQTIQTINTSDALSLKTKAKLDIVQPHV